MKKLSFSISVLFLFSLLLSSCSKEESTTENIAPIEARIEYHGSPAVDGCGYVLIVGSETYHPTNLEENFYVD